MKAKHRPMTMPETIPTQVNHAYSLVIYQAPMSQQGADKGHRDNDALEPHRPHVGMSENRAHREDDEREPEPVNVRHANQRAALSTGILFGQLFEGSWP